MSDAVLLSRMVDGVIFVVRGQKTSKHIVKSAVTQLEAVRLKFWASCSTASILARRVQRSVPPELCSQRFYGDYARGDGTGLCRRGRTARRVGAPLAQGACASRSLARGIFSNGGLLEHALLDYRWGRIIGSHQPKEVSRRPYCDRDDDLCTGSIHNIERLKKHHISLCDRLPF